MEGAAGRSGSDILRRKQQMSTCGIASTRSEKSVLVKGEAGRYIIYAIELRFVPVSRSHTCCHLVVHGGPQAGPVSQYALLWKLLADLVSGADSRSFRCLWALCELGVPFDLKVLPFPPRVLAKEYLKVRHLLLLEISIA
jgi:hypothetical protein